MAIPRQNAKGRLKIQQAFARALALARARLREKRIEQVTAAVATVLVLALFLWAGDAGLFEGILVYAVGGLAVWWWAKGTFWSRRLPADDEADDEAD